MAAKGETKPGRPEEAASLAARTDSYFLKTKAIVGHFGDRPATYAAFMRRPVICAPRFAIEFLKKMAAERGQNFDIELVHKQNPNHPLPQMVLTSLHLIERALLRLLIRTPAQELCAVTKAAAGEVIVLNFNN